MYLWRSMAPFIQVSKKILKERDFMLFLCFQVVRLSRSREHSIS